MKNKLIALFTVVLMLFQIVAPVMAMEVQDDKVEMKGTYNASDALAYAAEHWNDGVGLCADFVSACLRAGGISVSQAIVGNLLSALESGGYGTKYELRKNGSYFKMSENSDILSPGDPIFYRCHGCEANGNAPYRHVVLCGGSSNDYITYYAHNSAHGNTSNDKLCTYKCSNCGKTNWTFYSYHLSDTTASPEVPSPDLVPDAPTNVRSDKSLYTASESVHFEWDASPLATEYWVYMWKDGTQIYATSVGNSTSHGAAPMSAGEYTLIVRAGNAYGYSNGPASCSFIVYDSAPDAPTNVRSDKSLYTTSESVHFEWDASPLATEYWVYMWKDGTQIYSTSVGNSTSHSAAPLATGTYTLIVRAGNMYGYEDTGCQCSFLVYDNNYPEKPVVTINAGTSKTKTFISWSPCANAVSYKVSIYSKDTNICWQHFTDIKDTKLAIDWPAGEWYIYVTAFLGDGNIAIESEIAYFTVKEAYIITFNDGCTGETISTTIAEHGTDAAFPTPPEHDGYTFTGWDSDGKNITADTTITALYEESSSVILGDANGDGVINGKDVTLVRRYITGGYDVEVILEAADINGDGVINGKDITLLRRLIVGGYGDVA